MCGIAGFFSSNHTQQDLETMTNALAHRGPDAANYFYKKNQTKANGRNIGLGHRRLSIIDLSEAANQPFYSNDGRYVMVFNGEIYNYRQIARQLKLQCRTNSDTEVIIESFAKIGGKAIELFNGMFALVIYDQLEEELYFFRDRLGIKPLYYFYENESLVFASELKAIKAIVPQLKIDHAFIPTFLHLGYTPTPNTLYQNVFQLPAGSSTTVKNRTFTSQPFWELQQQVKPQILHNETIAKEQLRQLLIESVQHRLVADVSIGTFLSGGIDSSLVTAITQSIINQPVKTFSIGFEESKFNESKYAQKVAQHLKTDHYEFILSEQSALDQVENLLDIYDQPFADSSALPMLLVSQMARKHVTVALSGDGGDELFMGYGMYHWAKRLHHPILQSLRHPIAQLLKRSSKQRHQRAALVFDAPNKQKLRSHIFSQEQYFFSEQEITKLLTSKFPQKSTAFLSNEHFYNLARRLNPQEAQALFDLHYYLPDDLLTKVDRASMQHSLEVRVPLLDHNVVEFALNLDTSLKIKNGQTKYLLKQVLYDYVPAKMFQRPKWGFSIPLAKWLKNDLRYLIDVYLSEDVIGELGLVDLQQVQKLKQQFLLEGKDYLFNRIWVLVLLHKFLMK